MKNWHYSLLVAALGALALAIGCSSPQEETQEDPQAKAPVIPTEAGKHTVAFEHGGIARQFVLMLPSTYDGKTPMPLVLICHGNGETAESFSKQRTTLTRRANKEGWILVFPLATLNRQGKTTWNPTATPEPAGAVWDLVPNDAGFLLTALDYLEDQLAVAAGRTYVAGFSGGGRMTHHMASTYPERFAAAAPISTTITYPVVGGTEQLSTGTPKAPLPMLTAHGGKDPSLPIAGSATVSSFDDAIEQWVTANGCAMTPTTQSIAGDTVHLATYGDCTNGAEVIAITLDNMGHTWPDPVALLGWDASIAMLDFFEAHP